MDVKPRVPADDANPGKQAVARDVVPQKGEVVRTDGRNRVPGRTDLPDEQVAIDLNDAIPFERAHLHGPGPKRTGDGAGAESEPVVVRKFEHVVSLSRRHPESGLCALAESRVPVV